MGKPGGSHVPSSMNESIVHEKGTRGTETSKYPEEEKEKSIPSVAASESGGAQTNIELGFRTVTYEIYSRRMAWESQRYRVIVPYP